MSRIELLTVEDSFEISGPGVVVTPDFSVPDSWKNRTENVTIVKPDGVRYEATAQFSMSHIRISDAKVSSDRRWRVVLLLPDRTKDDVPVGSRILVSPEVRAAILPHNVAC